MGPCSLEGAGAGRLGVSERQGGGEPLSKEPEGSDQADH